MTFPFQLFAVMLLIITCSCSYQKNETNQASHSSDYKINNGLYLILNEFNDTVNRKTEGLILQFSHDFLDSNVTGQPSFLEIDTSELVSLELACEPEGIKQYDNRINLLITLTDSAGQQLADFTENHLNENVAIVIGGKAVTKHKVRSRIDGRKLQITRCTDNACQHLMVELRKNIKKDNWP